MVNPVRILFIDDHKLFRESMVRLLEREPELEVSAHCATLTEASRIVTTTPVDVVLLDYDLGEEVGTDFLNALHQTRSDVKVLMVTGGMGAKATLKAVDAGISGIILKHSDPHQLIEAIRRVAAGETWWDTGVLHSLGANTNKLPMPVESVKALTDKQRQVLRGILDGLTNKEIAARMQASETSIKASIQELFAKAGIRTRSQLVRIAIERYSSFWLEEKR
jgi:two-component system nitrate/nitrite response regulator NarL